MGGDSSLFSYGFDLPLTASLSASNRILSLIFFSKIKLLHEEGGNYDLYDDDKKYGKLKKILERSKNYDSRNDFD